MEQFTANEIVTWVGYPGMHYKVVGTSLYAEYILILISGIHSGRTVHAYGRDLQKVSAVEQALINL